MHIGTMVEFAFALVGKLDVINKHSFNDFKLRVGESLHSVGYCSAPSKSPSTTGRKAFLFRHQADGVKRNTRRHASRSACRRLSAEIVLSASQLVSCCTNKKENKRKNTAVRHNGMHTWL